MSKYQENVGPRDALTPENSALFPLKTRLEILKAY
jgi:hypothetical protein